LSLNQQITIHIGNRTILLFLLGALFTGFALPLTGVVPPMHLFLKHQTPQFEVVSHLDRELDELITQKQQLGLTFEKLAELEQKIEQANARLVAAILPPNKAPERRGSLPKLPPPPLPKSIDYSLSSSGLTEVPRLFVVRMSDLRPLDTELRKERFKQTILPLILRANEDIARQRKAVIQGIEAEDNDLLRSFAQRYRMPASLIDKQGWTDELLRRVAPVPVSIALAQAAIESGWGQSRFALEGNALFGQWVWNDKLGIKAANQSDPRASVRRFPDLLSSVRAYMFNLNSHWAYEAFREIRSRRLAAPEQVSVNEVIEGLSNYAQIGDAYIAKIRRIISQNDMQRFEVAQLVPRFF
tara:strand:+ start:2469 stop:3536 length:1068 start_codon:yes stop_codon:yes gene_type:complete